MAIGGPKVGPEFDKILLTQSGFDSRYLSISVVTKEVMEMLWDRHLQHHTDRIQEFTALFDENPSSETILRWIFEIEAHHCVLLRVGKWPLRPLYKSTTFITRIARPHTALSALP